MRLHALSLENIRSYKTQRIEFGPGKTLLQGDIGSGKSTVLLAVEFALFGILRGTLSGQALLRNGTRQGSVTLEFEVQGKRIHIKRVLRRVASSIEQSEGVLIIDGVVQNLTPTELKVRILELLGYPQELVTKSKSLLYRYTVYTPQEDMKRIILDSPQSRLDVLRKVFDIDRYKRVVENLQPILKDLRDRIKFTQGATVDIDAKQEKLVELSASLKQSKQRYEHTLTQQSIAEKELSVAREEFEMHNRHMTTIQHELRQRTRLESEISAMNRAIAQDNRRLVELQSQVQEAVPEPKMPDTPARETMVSKITQLQTDIRSAHQRIAACDAVSKQSEQVAQKIASLDQCPTCDQSVSTTHKNSISARENEKVQKLLSKRQAHELHVQELQRTLEHSQELLQSYDKSINEYRLLKYKFDEHRKRCEDVEKLKQGLQTSRINVDAMTKDLAGRTPIDIENIEKVLQSSKQRLGQAQSVERDLAISLSRLRNECEMLGRQQQELEGEIAKKIEAKKDLMTLQMRYDWLSRFFAPLSATIEKHVFLRIHQGFNQLFADWFSRLLEDEAFSARLDSDFTPIVEQNGYEMSLEHLSGGEKTACALAYRLALNHVINTIIDTIKTKDILILDEPTDGFSTEQLDRMRDVLDEIGLEQIIIVSHERKVESYVDSVLRVVKQEGQSQILLD